MTEKLKVIYMGTPDFAVPPLKRLIADGYDATEEKRYRQCL